MMEASEEDMQTMRAIADEIAQFRAEFLDSIRLGIEKEVIEMEESGFDPARGRGRGPKWADGG